MVNFILIFLLLGLVISVFSRSSSFDKVKIANLATGVYDFQNFEGVRVFQTEDGVNYLIIAVALKKGLSNSIATVARIASRKAKLYVSQYFSASILNADVLNTEVRFVTNNNGIYESAVNSITSKDIFKESSIDFIEGLELLTNFESHNTNCIIYLFYKKVDA